MTSPRSTRKKQTPREYIGNLAEFPMYTGSIEEGVLK